MGRYHWVVTGAVLGLWLSGCDFGGRFQQSPSAPPGPVDPFTAALEGAEAGERPYLDAARPFLTAVAARNYAAAYAELSSHARQWTSRDEFVPAEEGQSPAPFVPITQENFLAEMQRMEQARGVPRQISHVYVESIDPEVLSGRGDHFESMLAIGGIPVQIPPEVRRASIRAQIDCQLTDADIAQIAADLGISVDDFRQGRLPEDYDADDYTPYMNVKFVLVDDQGSLKVGYFEFMPPSILD